MPWSHCGETIADDEFACPSCGAAKERWTLAFSKTRVFKLGPSAWVELDLLGPDGEPVANAPYELLLPNGQKKAGQLDERGHVRVDRLSKGDLQLVFPGHSVEDFGPPAEVVGWIDIELRDPLGEPIPGARFTVTFKDDSEHEGRLDARGRARVPAPVHGAAQLCFHDYDEHDFGPTDPPLPPPEEMLWTDIELRGADGRPLAGEPFVARLPDGREESGRLDVDGRARVGSVTPGPIQLRFSSWTAEELERVTAEAAPSERPDALLELELLDVDGRPAANQEYSVTFPGGEVAEGRLDREGRARLRSPAPGPCHVRFPGYLAHELVPAAALEAALRDAHADAAPPPSGPALDIALQDEANRPLVGQRYRVLDQHGAAVARGRLDRQGRAVAAVPAAGVYQVIFPGLSLEDLSQVTP